MIASDSTGRPRGPKASSLKIDGDWESAAERVAKVKKPATGWPKEVKPRRRKKKSASKKPKA